MDPDPQKKGDKTIMYVCSRLFGTQDASDKFYNDMVTTLDSAIGDGTFRPTADEAVWKSTSVELSLADVGVGALHHKCYGINPTDLIVKLTETHNLIKLNKQNPNDYSVLIYIHQKYAAMKSCK